MSHKTKHQSGNIINLAIYRTDRPLHWIFGNLSTTIWDTLVNNIFTIIILYWDIQVKLFVIKLSQSYDSACPFLVSNTNYRAKKENQSKLLVLSKHLQLLSLDITHASTATPSADWEPSIFTRQAKNMRIY